MNERTGYVEDRLAVLDDGMNMVRARLASIEGKLELIIEAMGVSTDH